MGTEEQVTGRRLAVGKGNFRAGKTVVGICDRHKPINISKIRKLSAILLFRDRP
jgi:hypothetical protein